MAKRSDKKNPKSGKNAFQQSAAEIPLQALLNRINHESDIKALRALAKEIAIIGYIDSLTGLPNRHAFNTAAAPALEKTKRGGPLCYLHIDIDEFKSVNDTFGHNVGDRVLQETAQVLRGVLRRNDLIFRMGGEEILVIAAGTMRDGRIMGERLRSAVEGHDFQLPGRNVTISVGVSRSGPSKDVEKLLKAADEQTYVAKQEGRNRVRVAKLEPQ